MGKQTRNILAVAGVIGTVMGIIIAIPSFLQENLSATVGSTVLIIGGLILLAIAFGD